MIRSLSDIADSFPEVEVEYEDMIGWPYEVEGRTEGGIDCLGVVLEIYRRAGLGLPDPVVTPGGVLAFIELFDEVQVPDTMYDLISLQRSNHHVEVVVRNGLSLSAAEKRRLYSSRVPALMRVPGVKFYRVKPALLP